MAVSSSTGISPLRKQKPTGEIYQRDSNTEEQLLELKALSRSDLLKRCEVLDSTHGEYVRSECLVYLVRECRGDNSTAHFERLYKVLTARVLRALPRAESQRTNRLDLTNSKIREHAFDRFTELLALDRGGYDDRLDFYEVRFDGAVANLRRDARERAFREQKRTQPLEFDEESGELPVEVELAVRGYTPFDSPESSNDDYRLRLAEAIKQLTLEQIRIVHMLQQGILIDSKEPGVPTIAKALGKSEKTIRNQRDKAFAALRELLKAEKNS